MFIIKLYISIVAGDFTARLDEIAEKYQKMGICDGEECNQLRVQVIRIRASSKPSLHTG